MNNKLLFKTVTDYFDKIEKTQSRNSKTIIASELLGQAKENEIKILIYLLLGRVSPRYEKTDFNLGIKSVIAIYSEVFNIDTQVIHKKFIEFGDIGDTFVHMNKNNITKDLSLLFILKYLI